MKAKQPTLRERKRAAIVEAAILEFKEHGFKGASMDAISARAEVSKRTVYNHFSSKQELFNELARQLFNMSAELTQMDYRAELSLEQQLLEFAHKELSLLSSEYFMGLARILLAEAIHSPELAANAGQEIHKQEFSLVGWLRAAVEDKRLSISDPEYAANQFLGLIKACAFWPQITLSAPAPSKEEAQRIASDSVAMFLKQYQA